MKKVIDPNDVIDLKKIPSTFKGTIDIQRIIDHNEGERAHKFIIAVKDVGAASKVIEFKIGVEELTLALTGFHQELNFDVSLNLTRVGKQIIKRTITSKDYSHAENGGYKITNKKLADEGFRDVNKSKTTAYAFRWGYPE